MNEIIIKLNLPSSVFKKNIRTTRMLEFKEKKHTIIKMITTMCLDKNVSSLIRQFQLSQRL